jgi:hypothetical protein
MSRPPHPPRIYISNYTWRRVQIMMLIDDDDDDNNNNNNNNKAIPVTGGVIL